MTESEYDNAMNLADSILGSTYILPYTLLEYVTSDGTARIDSGIQYTDTISIEMQFSDNNAGVWSEYLNGNNTHWQKNDRDGLDITYARGNNYKNLRNLSISNANTYKMDKNKFYVNSVLKHTFNTETFSYSDTIKIIYNGAMNFYYCKIWDNEVLVRNFFPIKDSNNVACLYDLVTMQYYYSSGGSLIAGPIKT